jgi:hypothetical protein
MFSILFIVACWILIPWLAASSTVPLPLLLLLILPVLVLLVDRIQP